jgi:hypothetical protein
LPFWQKYAFIFWSFWRNISLPSSALPPRLLMFQIPLRDRATQWPKPNIRVIRGNSVKMTNILHQKAFEMHALEASRVTDTSLVELFPYISTLITVIVQKAVRLFTEP